MVRWTIIVPIKPLPAAKTRLRGAVPDLAHPDLVLAMAQDTVAAALACRLVSGVLVVCDDERVAAAMAALGARCVPDVPSLGLNAAIRYGQRCSSGEVAALTADLPALRPEELEEALAEGGRSFVPDAEGTGTVLLIGRPLDPHFGAGSAEAHERSGARRLDKSWPGLRRDIDTPADLARGRDIGLGRHTAGIDGRAVSALQGTVATFDPGTREGTVLLDDGREVAFPAAAFAASGLRLLRLGQRVRLDHGDDGAVVKITLPTLP
jgi:2-phospho-L-lactate/phosphoenolpyruvate guanylyltransferase